MYETLRIDREGHLTWLMLNRPEALNDAGSLEEVIAMEDRNQALTVRTADFREGVSAFLEKRPPKFQDE